jgi:K+/H+ antiporter YhaU regulatory subunit KhtT
MWTMRGDINIVKNDLRHLEESQKALSEAFSQLGKILTAVAVQDTRLTMIEKKIDELAHGHGYVETRN